VDNDGDYDLSTVLDGQPVNLVLMQLELRYVRLRAAASGLLIAHPELRELLDARDNCDYCKIAALLNVPGSGFCRE
jgi:hypothetical protein